MLKVKDSSLYLLPGNSHMLHLGTIQDSLKEYVVMLCISGMHKGKCYIEELVPTMISGKEDIYGNFKFIQDDTLAHDLARFADEKGLTDVRGRMDEILSYSRYNNIYEKIRRG